MPMTPRPAGQSIFVVDDDPGMRESLRFLLEGERYRVETYASARAFIEAGGPSRNGCIVADVRMPDMTGLELQAHLLKSGSAMPIILMTGEADVPMAVQAMKAGAIDFLEKPFADDAMLGSVRRALAQLAATGTGEPVAAAKAALLDRLTPRERDVLDHLVLGNPHKVIAHELGISPRTVEVHRAHIMQKLEARNHAHLIRMMLARG
jgi:two-component system response regulator FixJ